MVEYRLKKYIKRLNNVAKVAFQKTYVYPLELYTHHNLSFSQEGEDCILARLFKQQATGFYVDVGAHHPQRFSNTYSFYLKGWSGINIDAMPGSMEAFNRLRPRDINLEIPISDIATTLTYYIFDEPALNGFSKDISFDRDQNTSHELISKIELDTSRLEDVLSDHLPQGQAIDFLSIDVEGLDYQVLISNDWNQYRPKFVLVEDLAFATGDIESLVTSKVYKFMKSHNYTCFAKAVNTVFFRDTQ